MNNENDNEKSAPVDTVKPVVIKEFKLLRPMPSIIAFRKKFKLVRPLKYRR